MFDHLDAYPGDPILSLNEDFQRDPRPGKVNLSIGIYFDEDGRIPVLACVREAERRMLEQAAAKPYLPMEGSAPMRAAVQALLFGADSAAIAAGRIATVQTIGSSGGLKVGADFLHRWFADSGVWVSDPTWDNHRAIFEGAGMRVGTYPYYDATTGGLAIDAMLAALDALPARSIVLLHACCHNPTGVDPTPAQWQRIVDVVRRRELLAFVDIAYQGYGDGLEADARAIRLLAEAGVPLLVSNSFSKNLSVYGERCGALSVVCRDAAQADRVLGQLKSTVRRNYSSPGIHAAGIVATVLGDAGLRRDWEADVQAMRERIARMRRTLHDALARRMPGRDFARYVEQRGMFTYTGLDPQQVRRLREERGVYLIGSGRMCVAGLDDGNVERTADAIAAVMA